MLQTRRILRLSYLKSVTLITFQPQQGAGDFQRTLS
jgi:hypothetical protein